MNNSFNSTKVITGVNTRWSYCNVWEPKSINGGTPKYSVSLIIPKTDTVTVEKIKKAIEVAYKEGESKLKGTGKSVPALQAIKTPLRDGDLERPDDEAYKGCYFINAGYDPYEKKLLGITSMTNLLGRTKFNEVLGNLIYKPQGKPTLVLESDKRPAMEINDFIEEIEENKYE